MIEWMETGQELTEQAGGQEVVLSEVAALNWHTLPCSAPFCQGWAIGHLIKEVIKGKPTLIAWDGVLCNRYDLIGIEATYPNGTYRHYWADTGTGLIPLLTVQH